MWRSVSLLLLAFTLPATAAGVCEGACAQRYPADGGMINVRDFGAKGDGRTDDTGALLAAIAAAGADTGAFFWRTRIVYVPMGTYRVSHSLVKRYADGRFGSGMMLVGESKNDTVIKLTDHAPDFSDRDAPRGVIMTTAKLLDGTPTSGGKDYTHKGEGNDAYENFVENLTIDVGSDNPGAIGIDYLANNIGAIRDVRVIAPAGSGSIGIAMQRKWPGPALLQRIEVQGFNIGIAVANTEYGVTLEHIRLDGQRQIGLANASNSVAAADLTIIAPATAIANTAPQGLVVLTNVLLKRDGEGAAALENRGIMVVRGVSLDGFPAPQETTAPLFGVWQGGQWHSEGAQQVISLPDAPSVPAEPPENWINVLHGGKPPTQPLDITDALRKAMATGAATIYLPHGRYIIRDGIVVPSTLRRIVGMNASITVAPERRPDFARDTGILKIEQSGPPLTIERLAFDMTDLGDQLAVELTAQRDVTLRDIVTAGASLLDRGAGGGRVFIEDVCCGSLRIAGPSPVYARQLNTEGGGTRIVNDGSPLVILGLKTEGDCTVLDNRNGAHSSILGGLLYIVGQADPKVPAFRNVDASLQASFVEESFSAESRYAIYLQDKRRSLRTTNFPARGYGRLVPWLTTDR